MAEALRGGLSALERRHGGRLGVAVLYAGRQRVIVTQRGEERFAFCSTYKVLAAGCVLGRVDRGVESLGRRVVVPGDGLVAYSPVCEGRAGGEMTVGELCEAAVCFSDNTAANLLLDSFGGPGGLTAFMRELGDGVSRLDRVEPFLNDVVAGDVRDTTTPGGMARLVDRLVLGSGLKPGSRAVLAGWLVGSRTGGTRIRAGVPGGWRVGDKTGSGVGGAMNDVAVMWPGVGVSRGGMPRVVAVFYAGAEASAGERDAVLAEVGRLAAG